MKAIHNLYPFLMLIMFAVFNKSKIQSENNPFQSQEVFLKYPANRQF